MSAEDKKKLDGIVAEAMTFSEIDAICIIPLDPGLYQDGVMTMSWDELFDNNIFNENLFVNAGRLVAENKTSLVGELILFPDAYMLDSDAFSDATSLTSVTIPATISKIGADAFSNCTSLTSVKFEGTMSQWSELARLSGLSVMGKDYWAANAPFTQVICSDGTITL
jgi:hypothetical protein